MPQSGMIDQNYKIIKQKIDSACKKAGRDFSEIILVAVTKTIKPEIIGQAYSLGLKDFGENKVQELLTKVEDTPKDINWHFIGHLQRNKVKHIRSFVQMVHSVDSLSLAVEIDKNAKEVARKIPILIQINTSNEESKYGIEPENAVDLVKNIAGLSNIKVMGLMTIGNLVDEPEKARPCFRLLKEIKEKIIKLNIENVEMKHLSMGMTNDFEVAIEEGATIIRIGTALFGSR
jgi:PLP dependent protein